MAGRGRGGVIEAVLDRLREELEKELPGEEATEDEIEDAVARLQATFHRELTRHLVVSDAKDRPTWVAEIDDRLAELVALPENWNSYGARRVDPAVARSTRELLLQTVRADTPRPALVPTSHGGIQIEWHTEGVDLEIEIPKADRYLVLWERARDQGEEELELGPGDLPRLRQLVASVSSEPASRA
jgi:hypothetical protein